MAATEGGIERNCSEEQPVNAPVSIRHNLEHFANVNDERLLHREKDFAARVTTEEGMQIDWIDAPTNADPSIREMVKFRTTFEGNFCNMGTGMAPTPDAYFLDRRWNTNWSVLAIRSIIGWKQIHYRNRESAALT
jgi:hypothetical protein